MSFLKIGLAELRLYSGQFTLQDGDKKISAPARWLQEARINALGLALHEVKHLFDQPRRRKNLPVVYNAPLGFDQIHRLWPAISTSSLWWSAATSFGIAHRHVHDKIAHRDADNPQLML